MRHEARQVPSWLIFDVRQNNLMSEPANRKQLVLLEYLGIDIPQGASKAQALALIQRAYDDPAKEKRIEEFNERKVDLYPELFPVELMYCALERDDPALLKKALTHGASPEHVNELTSQVPLQIAIRHNAAQCIPVLINAGANAKRIVYDERTSTPATLLEIALRRGKNDCASALSAGSA